MRNLLLTFLIFSLAAPDALAAGNNPGRRRNTPRPAAAATQQPPKTPQQEADMKKLCEQDPLAQITKPKEPSSGSVDITADIPDG